MIKHLNSEIFQVVRSEYGREVVLAQYDFEDIDYFIQIARCPQYKILCGGEDVTHRFVASNDERI